MRKIINRPENFVDETVEGILLAYGDRVKLLNDDKRVILTNSPVQKGKVGIVTAGGSGHLPVFLGYVGQGMLDGCAVGNVFASPSSQKMADMIKACDYGSGVLCLYGNYGGDNMNFDMACELVEFDDVETRTVRVKDDVASSPKETADKRRGVAGMVYAFKLAGAAAEKMMSLDEVTAVAEKALANIRTMGVALSPCIVPEVGKPTFSIQDDEIEIGMGIHGERGIEVRKMMTADEIAQTVLDKILADMPLQKGDEVSVMVNGLGATPLEEQLIVYRKVHHLLAEKGITVYMPHIGEFATSMEMAGLSITVLKLDEQLKELLRSPASTPFYTNANK
ncbi:dihydroxyacetone kinase DhaK subunit [Hydrogenoanaerobacterium saccharovorans]|uniref:Dihydroxyacetone kinase DhaK subunit n=1 Tax=Hydrogenoanaerobacterium saccharovorans TaxID=474960 RepID=A0A1H8B8H3_9FIRM|nr:dihydroxyacetone kinase subunit DhaK [Hydrogenoanaerobacterium saccharovorans]RPF47565.1 dihydroxyacetone kinase DhaK subunit [Hydrogenoanaerobacterium saccharovorans]SEM78424.1 dihydroxyacetone kinase DhaK subunit [Hydrogenoanaerobacterium saccharovorans]